MTSVPSRRTPRRSTAARWRALVAVAAAGTAALLGAAAPASAAVWPTDDPFYAAPADLASIPNGDVIRSRKVPLRTAPGIKLPFKTEQVLYRTTDRLQRPIASVATIIQPLKRPATGRKLLSYQTAYDGLSPACQPSYSLQTGKTALQGAETLIMMGALQRGWTIVTSDYEGPDNAWLVRETSGRGVLDGIRAAERYAGSGLPEGAATPVGMMGYSGGGQATAFANELAPTYAPELNIVGASQGGVAANLTQVFRSMDGNLFAGMVFGGIAGVSAGYPDVDINSYLNGRGKSVMRKLRTKTSCVMDFALSYPFWKVKQLTTVGDLLSVPAFKTIAEENSLGRDIPKAPVFMYHTTFDQMEGYNGALKLAETYCGGGTKVRFVSGYKEEHAMQSATMPFKAQAWLADRFAGIPTDSNCARLR